MKEKPKVLLMENVPDLLSDKFKQGWHEIYHEIELFNYTNHVDVLNSKDYGVAQNRDRVFMLSNQGDYAYEFPKPFPLIRKLKEYLEPHVDEKYYLTDEAIKKIQNWKSNQQPLDRIINVDGISPTLTARGAGENHSGMILIDEYVGIGVHPLGRKLEFKGFNEEVSPTLRASDYKAPMCVAIGSRNKMQEMIDENGNIKRYLNSDKVDIFNEGDCADLSFPNGYNKAKRVTKGYAQAITCTTVNNLVTKDKFRIRKLTPLECWRLMGISDEDFYKAQASGVSNSQLYKQAGNAIVVDVLVAIFRNLLKGA